MAQVVEHLADRVMHICELLHRDPVLLLLARKDSRLHQYRREGLYHLVVQLSRELAPDLQRLELSVFVSA
ncbi:MAG: hypothetical protein AUI15_25350 [Actinobacteria bacterium 13_2_20CM_2_66_6]|nr:MAG: hypothetical protein AUI15_25350 [Actinobacteria bacterium 13_2_20CM_2_66_6]